jgi:hypothetical protein
MSRARKPAETPDGMSWIALMPFPAFNPLNWWALATPEHALKASLHNTRLALDAWRAGADGMRAMLRTQQDTLLSMAAAPVAEREEAGGEARADDAQAAADDAPAAAADFVRPMLEVTRAYGRVGKAFIVAQRDTMRAFTEAGKPH